MKTFNSITKIFALTFCLFFSFGNSTDLAAQGYVQSKYRDMVTYLNNFSNESRSIPVYRVGITVINPATARGTHFFTSYSEGMLILDKARGEMDLIQVTDFFVRYDGNRTIAEQYSDRKNGNQAFASNRSDKYQLSINYRNGRLSKRSLTWGGKTTINSLTRSGNILSARTSNGGMIVLNIKKEMVSFLH